MKYLILGVIVLGLAWMFVISPKTEDPMVPVETENRTYSSELGFNIMLPDGVTVQSETQNAEKFMRLGPYAIANSEITDGYALIVSKDPLQSAQTFEEYARWKLETVRANMGTNISELEEETVGENRAYKYSYTNVLESRSTEYLVLMNTHVYLASYVVADPQNVGYENEVREMIQSIRPN
jgi:hypothetical protein